MDLFDSDKFADRVQQLLDEWHCPGLAVGIVHGDQVSSRGFGKASLEPEKPVTPDTIFDIASCSKSLTAGAVALLVEDDERYPKVKWDAKMSDLLKDDFVMSEGSYTKDVTVEDVMSHRSGLPSHDLSYMHSDTPRSVTRNLRNLPISKPIRVTEQYCNMMYTVASHLVEDLSKQPFAEFLRDNFWKPLGMDSTFLQPQAVIDAGLQDRLFTPHRWDKDQKRYIPAKIQQIPEAQGAGSIFTCARDYVLWIKALIHHEAPVTKEVYSGMTKPRTISNPNDSSNDDLDPFMSPMMYGAGVEMQYYRGHKIACHSGGDPGIGAFIFMLPGKKFGGVLFGNSWRAGEVATVLARELMDHVLEVPEDQRPEWNKRMHKDDDEYEAKKDDRCKEMLGLPTGDDLPASEPQEQPLDLYTGTYTNVGYHEMVVNVKDGCLFIDASNRTMGFYLTLEHFKDQTLYIAHMEDYYDGATRKMTVKFDFDENGEKVIRMGVDLEEDIGDYVWFDRRESSASHGDMPVR